MGKSLVLGSKVAGKRHRRKKWKKPVGPHPLMLARKFSGLSQLDLSRRVGVSRATIQAIEYGRRRQDGISPDLAPLFSAVLGVRPGSFEKRGLVNGPLDFRGEPYGKSSFPLFTKFMRSDATRAARMEGRETFLKRVNDVLRASEGKDSDNKDDRYEQCRIQLSACLDRSIRLYKLATRVEKLALDDHGAANKALTSPKSPLKPSGDASRANQPHVSRRPHTSAGR